MRKKSIHEVKPGVDERVEKAVKKAKASRAIQDQIKELLHIEPFDYLKCIELCIKFCKKKHHIFSRTRLYNFSVKAEKKVAKKAKDSRSIQDQIRELLVVEPFDYLKCIELCIEFGKKKHHIDNSKDDLLGLAKYESCLG